MMEISQRQRDSHIPTTSTTILPHKDPKTKTKTKTKNPQWRPWKSGNPKAEFLLSHRPNRLRRKVKTRSSRRQRGATAQDVNPRRFYCPRTGLGCITGHLGAIPTVYSTGAWHWWKG
jgi:hypothetical protein